MKIAGFTLIELVVTIAILGVLASAALPMLQVTVQRNKENELRANLREIREAIDAYKKAADEGRIKKSIEDTGYPPNLELLVEGVEDQKDVNKRKIKFLRRLPLDPMHDTQNGKAWGLRSYASEVERPQEGADVYDIYSLSQQVGTNGVAYAQW